MEDILKRLGNLEAGFHELKPQVSAILAVIPHLATKADLMDVRADLSAQVADVRADLSAQVAEVRADLSAQVAEVRADLSAQVADVRASVADVRTSVADVRTSMAAMETAIIKWIIATTLTTGALAFTIAKFVH